MMFGSSLGRFHSGCGQSNYSFGSGYYGRSHITGCLTDPKITSKFVKAIKENDVKTVRKMLKKGGLNLNEAFRFDGEQEKMTALHFVAKEGMVHMLKELLTSECDVNAVTAFDIATPLHFACQKTDADVAMTMAEDLIGVGADVNVEDHAQKTPLIMASENGNLLLVRLLLDNGANVNHKYYEEELPSCVYHALKFVTMTPPQAEEKVDAYHGNNALIQACRAHHVSVVKELINRGANLNISNTNGNTPLHIACQSECKYVYSDLRSRHPVAGNSAIVKLLIEKGANINARNNFTDTPLKRTFDGIVSLSGWSYPIEDRIQETSKMLDIVQILLHSGCDVTMMYEEVVFTNHSPNGDPESLPVVLKTALHYFLNAGRAIALYDSTNLTKHWCICLQLMIAAGCQIDPLDLLKAETISHITPELLTALREACGTPHTLKQLCNITIRNAVQKPLKLNVMKLSLPIILTKLLTLEICD